MKLKSILITVVAMIVMGLGIACDPQDEGQQFPSSEPETPGGFEQPEPQEEPYAPESP